jgi:hypothetical protein
MPHTSPDASTLKNTGSYGSIFVTTTALYTGEFFAIQAIDDCTFLTLSANNMENVQAWVTNNITLNAGSVIHAEFTAVSLSGIGVLYKH